MKRTSSAALALVSFTACDAGFLFGIPRPSAPDTSGTCDLAIPTGLAGEPVAAGIELTWPEPAGDVDGVEVQRYVGSAYQEQDFVALPARTYTDEIGPGDHQIELDNVYEYRIVAKKSGCSSEPSEVLEVYTFSALPTGLSATARVETTDTIDLAWTDANSYESGYGVARRAFGTASYAVLTTAQGADTESYADSSGLSGDSHYEYAVFGLNHDGLYDFEVAAELEAWTNPNPPADASAEVNSTTSATLTWTDTNSNETGYRVTREPAGGGPTDLSMDLPADTEEFTDNSLTVDTEYLFKIYAHGPGGFSPAAEVHFGAKPLAVTGLTAAALSATSIRLTWIDPNAFETGYRIA